MSTNSPTESNSHMACCSASESGGHCPMSVKFNKTVGNPKFRISLFSVGIVFILLGIVILIWPVVAVWLTAAVSILIGFMVITAAVLTAKMN